ncbi:hypothetical protein JCM17380_45220 [Desulfosporosinus burensis]
MILTSEGFLHVDEVGEFRIRSYIESNYVKYSYLKILEAAKEYDRNPDDIRLNLEYPDQIDW